MISITKSVIPSPIIAPAKAPSAGIAGGKQQPTPNKAKPPKIYI